MNLPFLFGFTTEITKKSGIPRDAAQSQVRTTTNLIAVRDSSPTVTSVK